MGFPSYLRGADLAPLGLVCTSPRADALVGPFFLYLLYKKRTGKQSQDDYHRH